MVKGRLGTEPRIARPDTLQIVAESYDSTKSLVDKVSAFVLAHRGVLVAARLFAKTCTSFPLALLALYLDNAVAFQTLPDTLVDWRFWVIAAIKVGAAIEVAVRAPGWLAKAAKVIGAAYPDLQRLDRSIRIAVRT